MKRAREEDEVDRFDKANCLMLLSKVGQINNTPTRRSFQCKTCNREFSSFQALGGHRASHKKPKLMMMKPKMHECHICGVEFGIGQALGGHMRKHRAEAVNDGLVSHGIAATPVLGKSISEGIDLLSLDLNLTPLENDLKLGLRPPWVNCFI